MNDAKNLCDSFDAMGIFPRPGETEKDFLSRAGEEKDCHAARKLLREDPYFRNNGATPIPPDVLTEGTEITERLYGFSAGRVPGCFLKRGFGLFWGGCTLADENGTAVIALRGSFQNRKHWFLYDRAELLAHEQCHAARTPLNDNVHEEFFAYQTSLRRLRRYLGNCFRSRLDGLFFLAGLIPLFLAEGCMIAGVLSMDFPLTPLLGIALLYPAFALIRNQRARNLFFRAEKNLKDAGCKMPAALLFRATAHEIERIAKCGNETETRALLNQLRQDELRWQIALRRFPAA